MASLTLEPTAGHGGSSFQIKVRNRPDLRLSQATSVTLSQVGSGGALHIRLSFRAINDELIEATIPPVAAGFTGSAIISAYYEVFVVLPRSSERSISPFHVLAGSAVATGAGAAASTPAATSGSASSAYVIGFPLHPLRRILINTPGGITGIPVAGAGNVTPTSTSPATNTNTQPHNHNCGCCCHCCKCCCGCNGHQHGHTTPATTTTPTTAVPPPGGSSGVVGVVTGVVTGATGSAGTAATPGPTPGASGSAVAGAPSEMKIRWVVESTVPLREGKGPDLISAGSDPDLYSDNMNGVFNGGEIPVEPISDGNINPENPPIKEFDFIVSTQALTPGNDPIEGQKITFEWLNKNDIANDGSLIMEVSNNDSVLKDKIINNTKASGTNYAYSNTEGKAFCWVRIKLYDEDEVTDVSLRLKGIKAIIGEVTKPAPASYGSGTTMVRPSAAATATRVQEQQRTLIDMLVDNFHSAVETFAEWVEGKWECVAGLPRTIQRAVGFALKRVADAIIIMYPLPLYSVALINGFEKELRAVVVGLLLGVPRGIYVMARDTIQDIGSLLIDLPRALFNFISEDPKFALQILGAIVNPSSGVIAYNLDPTFRDKINKALSKFKGLLENISNVLGTLWTSLREQSTVGGLTAALGNYLYDDFSKFVGDIGTEYLDYEKDKSEYRYFVGGFIAGDFLGYILSTIGVEVLLAWFTGGIGNAVSVVSKLGRLGEIGALGLRIVRAFLLFLKKIEDFIGDAVAVVGATIKKGIGKVLSALIKLISTLMHPAGEHLIKPVLKAIFEFGDQAQKRVVEMLYRLSLPEELEGVKIEQLAEGLVNGTQYMASRSEEEVIRDTLHALSRMSEDIRTNSGGRVPGNQLMCNIVIQ